MQVAWSFRAERAWLGFAESFNRTLLKRTIPFFFFQVHFLRTTSGIGTWLWLAHLPRLDGAGCDGDKFGDKHDIMSA